MEIDLATLESLAEELMPVPDIAIFLGVPEPDLNVEYELTSFGLAERARTDRPYYFASLVKRMKACPGANLNEQIEWYALNELGLTENELASIRRNLTAESKQ